MRKKINFNLADKEKHMELLKILHGKQTNDQVSLPEETPIDIPRQQDLNPKRVSGM